MATITRAHPNGQMQHCRYGVSDGQGKATKHLNRAEARHKAARRNNPTQTDLAARRESEVTRLFGDGMDQQHSNRCDD